MGKARFLTAAAACAALLAAAVAAQDRAAPRSPKDYPAPRAYPQEDAAAVAEHLSRARRIAGGDLFGDFAHRCIISPV